MRCIYIIQNTTFIFLYQCVNCKNKFQIFDSQKINKYTTRGFSVQQLGLFTFSCACSMKIKASHCRALFAISYCTIWKERHKKQSDGTGQIELCQTRLYDNLVSFSAAFIYLLAIVFSQDTIYLFLTSLECSFLLYQMNSNLIRFYFLEFTKNQIFLFLS